jgi:hypothetical protein
MRKFIMPVFALQLLHLALCHEVFAGDMAG